MFFSSAVILIICSFCPCKKKVGNSYIYSILCFSQLWYIYLQSVSLHLKSPILSHFFVISIWLHYIEFMKNSKFSYSLKHLRTFFPTSHFKMGLKHSFIMSFSFDLLMISLCRCLVISVTYLHLIWVTQTPLISFLCNVEETILLLLTAKETCFHHVSFLFSTPYFMFYLFFFFPKKVWLNMGMFEGLSQIAFW